ncbi:hypothetical protein F5I97DRAFT_1809565 [Phlebopus sp. FC_14]|nr:hypothetical protein F5I97DRAFT_1809565 [Phlebopus sp. FC_14]
MAPNFLSKLVKGSSTPSPVSSSPSTGHLDSSRRNSGSRSRPHSQTISHPPSTYLSTKASRDDIGSDSSSARDSFKIGIVPPSPRTIDTDFSAYQEPPPREEARQEPMQHRRVRSQDQPVPDRHAISLAARPMSGVSVMSEDIPTPTLTRHNPAHDWSTIPAASPRSSRQLTPASSTGNLKGFVDKHASRPVPDNLHVAERKTSQQSLRSQTQPSKPQNNDQLPKHIRNGSDVLREGERHEDSGGLVESPSTSSSQKALSQELLGALSDADATSVQSATSASSKKQKTWRKPSISTPSRKPSGIASAIAASGLTMANATSQVPPVPVVPASASKVNLSQNGTKTKDSSLSSRSKVQHTASASMHSMLSGREAGPHSRNMSLSRSDFSDGQYQSDTFGSSEASSGSDDELDLNEDDIPVTGFAVASNKRNADFHELFPPIPEGDYLIEDYGCALQREILIQGRLYVSENHICFHANIFGWITDLSIPIYEITALEKRMTAFVIPNAIQITTRQAKYTFASFLSRDTTYDVIVNIWRLARPGDSLQLMESRTALAADAISTTSGLDGSAVEKRGVSEARFNKVTHCSCSKNGGHLSEVALETVLPGTPDKIYNLMFTSGFIKDFMRLDQKLTDIQISDWCTTGEGSKLLARNMSYIKPLNNSVGPKQTKCEIHDENLYCDFEDHVVMLTTTRTPDVPSGGVFAVKTRTCIMWESAISTRVIVTTQVDWTGRSFIKGLIEKSAIEGQKVYHSDLDKAMRMYIQEHQSEFIPEGIDPSAVAPVEPITPIAELNGAAGDHAVSDEEARKARERDRNRRGLQWAYDTLDGAYGVAKRSTIGALELVKEAWEQSSSTTILWFLIVLLVLSNVWTLALVGNREEVGRRKEARRTEEREKWVQGIVTGIWEEMAAGRVRPGVALPVPSGPVGELQTEVVSISRMLEAVEERVRVIRESLEGLN